MQRNLKILYISSEIAPFVKSGNLADVAGALPKALKDMGHDVRLFIPKYGTINDRKFTLREVIRLKEIKVPLNNKTVLVDVKSAFLPNSKVQVYFVENKEYFDRPELYIDPNTNKEWEDNAERFIFFCRSIFAILKKLHWQPDIIHCNDWQTALIPFFLKHTYSEDSFFVKTQTLLTIHDLSSQGIYNKNIVTLISDDADIFYTNSIIEYQGKVNFLKAGIVCADIINTTGKSYARELRISDESSFGLRQILKIYSKKLFAIANGVDYLIWNPEIDTLIPYNYSRRDIHVKSKNKQNLVETQGLKFSENIPVLGTFSHLLDHNDVDILGDILEEMLNMDLQFIILNNGNDKYQKMVQSLAKKYPEKITLGIKFDERLVHTMVAGCDIFIIPCRFEPCGSVQLSCLKYGTIPIVYASGGLLDTIKDFNPETKKGYGLVFDEYSPLLLLDAVKRSVEVFNDKIIWKKLVDRAMRLNFSWQVVAENYVKLYYKLLN